MLTIRRTALWGLSLAAVATLACSGGPFVGPSSSGSATTIHGTTVVAGQPGSGGRLAAGPSDFLKVCVKGTNRCADVKADGTFELSGDFDGDVTLLFTSAQGTITLKIDDVRPGETVVVTVTINGASATLTVNSREGGSEIDDDESADDDESEDDASEDDESEDDESEDDESEDDESEDDESEDDRGQRR